MKNTTLILIFIFFFTQNSFSQVTPAKYEPRSFEEMARLPMALKAKYDENQKYLYQLKKWILELKTQIQGTEYLNRLDKEYKDLTDIEDADLARATKYLQQTEIAVSEIVSDYKMSYSQTNTRSTTTNTNSSKPIFKTSTKYEVALRSGPSINSNKIFMCPANAEVLVFDNSGTYYKVVVNGYSGYISKANLKRQW